MDKAGLETMLRLCRKQMNFEWFGDAFNSGNCETYSVYEYAWSDLAVMGGTETKEIHNMVTQLTPCVIGFSAGMVLSMLILSLPVPRKLMVWLRKKTEMLVLPKDIFTVLTGIIC